MGAEKLGQRAQGPGLQKGGSERPPRVSRPWGVRGGGQGATGGSFHRGAGLDGFWGSFLSQVRRMTPHIRSAGGLKSCLPQLPTWACSLLSAAQPALTATPQAEGAAGRGDGTSQALAVASPHSYLPARGEGRTQGPVLSEGQAA